MKRADVVDLVVDLVDVDLDVDLVDVDLDDQKYDFCLSRTDLNIVDGLNRNTCTCSESMPSVWRKPSLFDANSNTCFRAV